MDAEALRIQLRAIMQDGTYENSEAGDADFISDFEIIARDYAQAKERAALARIRAVNAASTPRRSVPERPVTLTWLHGAKN